MSSTPRRTLLKTVAGMAVGASIAGCTQPVALDMPSSELVGGPDDRQSELTVYLYAPYMFRPMVAFIEQGTTVTWTHAGNETVLHSSTAFGGTSTDLRLIPKDAQGWNSGPFAARKDPYRRTFDTPGVYVYYCMPHKDFGMAGILIVGDIGPDDPGWSPAMTEPVKQQDVLSPVMTEKIDRLRSMVKKQYNTNGRSEHRNGGESS